MRPPLRQNRYDVCVVGGGVAGLTAAWHAARHGLTVVLVEGSGQYGGQVATTPEIDGCPPGGRMTGVDFALGLHGAAEGAGVAFVLEEVSGIETDFGGFVLRLPARKLLARSVILATGARRRKLGVKGEDALEGRGISHCAACDGPLYRDKDVVVVGGGNAALQQAVHLAALARSVTLLVRGGLRARRWYVDRAEACPNLRFRWSSTVAEIIGGTGVEGVLVETGNGERQTLSCHGVFPFIGSEPDTNLAANLVRRDGTGAVLTGADLGTDLPGFFAVGAVRSGYGGEIVDAASDGARAAKAVATFLAAPARQHEVRAAEHAS